MRLRVKVNSGMIPAVRAALGRWYGDKFAASIRKGA